MVFKVNCVFLFLQDGAVIIEVPLTRIFWKVHTMWAGCPVEVGHDVAVGYVKVNVRVSGSVVAVKSWWIS